MRTGKKEAHKKHFYYCLRVITCILLIGLQIMQIAVIIIFIFKARDLAGTLANLVIDQRMLPLAIAHGSALIISPVVDVYLTL